MLDLFTPAILGDIQVKNRIFMAPLTRNRAHDDTDIPTDMAIEYYRQRASAGLIITEATQINPMGKGYFRTPGIYTQEQVKKWQEIVRAVHEEEGKIFLQLWHVGRIAHTDVLPEDAAPFAPSAIKANATVFTQNGPQETSEPVAMSADDIKNTIEDFRIAAENAKKAGFDGVEVHAANGYLINQFLCDQSNHRTDEYGRSLHGRYHLLNEILHAVLSIWPGGRVGVRLSPTGTFNDIKDSDPLTTFSHVIEELNKLDLAYVHFVEKFPGTEPSAQDLKIIRELRQKWDGFYIANGGYDSETGKEAIARGQAGAVAYGRPFIANPDLPRRFEIGAKLNEPNQDTFYGGDEKGYTDYPFLSDEEDAIAAAG